MPIFDEIDLDTKKSQEAVLNIAESLLTEKEDLKRTMKPKCPSKTIKVQYNHSHCLWFDGLDSDETLRQLRTAIEQNASEKSE
jgi:hypothetical protein